MVLSFSNTPEDINDTYLHQDVLQLEMIIDSLLMIFPVPVQEGVIDFLGLDPANLYHPIPREDLSLCNRDSAAFTSMNERGGT